MKVCFPLKLSAALPFAVCGLDALLDPQPHRERAAHLTAPAEALGLKPLRGKDTDRLTRLTGALLIAGSAALVRNSGPVRAAGFALAALQIPLALANNPFWTYADSGQRRRCFVRCVNHLGPAAAALLVGKAAAKSVKK